MSRLFAVTRSRGPAWQVERPMEEQEEWRAHAVFMNALHRDGFIVLGGPLDGTPDVLLIARATERLPAASVSVRTNSVYAGYRSTPEVGARMMASFERNVNL